MEANVKVKEMEENFAGGQPLCEFWRTIANRFADCTSSTPAEPAAKKQKLDPIEFTAQGHLAEKPDCWADHVEGMDLTGV